MWRIVIAEQDCREQKMSWRSGWRVPRPGPPRIQEMTVAESPSIQILSACRWVVAAVMPAQAALSSASGTDGSNKGDPPAKRSRPSESLITKAAPPARPRTLPSKLTLTNGVLFDQVNVMDTLSRLSHDTDGDVSMAAIFSLGLIGAGTNNARIAGMLRNLSSYYYKEAGHLFCVRIAQGLVHMGKGLLTLSPYHSDRFLLSPMALAGLVTVLHACLDMKSIILGKYHYMLYVLVLAMQPRMLMTVDENLKPLSVPVRVGQAVDVVGQAGRPKTITGFQTHSTPVLLAAGERAELATEKYIPLTSVLEGFVILRENPDYRDDH